jgi:hypothetical protein
LLGGVDRPSPRERPLAQAIDPLVIEAVDPGVDGGPGDAEFVGDLAGSLTPGDGQDDPGPPDEAGLDGAGVSQPPEGPEFLVGRLVEGDVGEVHGYTPFASHILFTSQSDR